MKKKQVSEISCKLMLKVKKTQLRSWILQKFHNKEIPRNGLGLSDSSFLRQYLTDNKQRQSPDEIRQYNIHV